VVIICYLLLCFVLLLTASHEQSDDYERVTLHKPVSILHSEIVVNHLYLTITDDTVIM